MNIYLVVSALVALCSTIHARAACTLSVADSYSLPASPSISSPYAAVFSPDGSYLAVANELSNNVTILNATNGVLSGATTYALPPNCQLPQSLAFSPDGSYLAIANSATIDDTSYVTIFAVTAGVLSEGTSYALPSGLTVLTSTAFSPDSSYLAIAAAGSVSSGSYVDAGITLFTLTGCATPTATTATTTNTAGPSSVATGTAASGTTGATTSDTPLLKHAWGLILSLLGLRGLM